MGVLVRRFVLSGSLLFLRQLTGIPGAIPTVVAQEFGHFDAMLHLNFPE